MFQFPFGSFLVREAEDQRASSLIKRFSVLAPCFSQGVCVSLAGGAGRGELCPTPPANPPDPLSMVWGAQRPPAKTPPLGTPWFLLPVPWRCLVWGSFAAKPPKKQKVGGWGHAQANLCQVCLSQLRRKQRESARRGGDAL